MPNVEQAAPAIVEHGEGPVWSESWGGLRYVDMLAGDIVSLDDTTGKTSRMHVGTVAAAFRPRTGGRMVVAAESEFLLIDPDGATRSLGAVFTDPAIRFNEGSCTPDGAFWCGTMAYAETVGAGTVFGLSPSGAVSTVLPSVTISNGLAFTSDGATGYYVDSATGRIDVFDYADGGISGRRPFVSIDPALGAPDGIALDAEGGVWVALWGGGAVHRYSSDGKLSEVLQLPTDLVTACCFGGPGLDRLYITTSQLGKVRGSEPGAGAVFVCTPGVSGLPVLSFAG